MRAATGIRRASGVRAASGIRAANVLRRVPSSGISYDADVAAYIASVEGASGNFDYTAANPSATADVVKLALDTLVKSYKAVADWSKVDNFEPIIGGNSAAHAMNLKDLTKNFQMLGTMTHDSNGMTGNGTNGGALTAQLWKDLFTNDYGRGDGLGYDGSILFWNGINIACGFRCKTDNNGGGACWHTSFETRRSINQWSGSGSYWSDFDFFEQGVCNNGNSLSGVRNPVTPQLDEKVAPYSTLKGLHVRTSQGITAGAHKAYIRGTDITPLFNGAQGGLARTVDGNLTAFKTLKLGINCEANYATGTRGFNTANLRFFATTREVLSASQVTAVNAALVEFQTTLGRAG